LAETFGKSGVFTKWQSEQDNAVVVDMSIDCVHKFSIHRTTQRKRKKEKKKRKTPPPGSRKKREKIYKKDNIINKQFAKRNNDNKETEQKGSY